MLRRAMRCCVVVCVGVGVGGGGGGVARVQFLAILARHTLRTTGTAPTRGLPGAAPPPRGATGGRAASNPPRNNDPQALPSVGRVRWGRPRGDQECDVM